MVKCPKHGDYKVTDSMGRVDAVCPHCHGAIRVQRDALLAVCRKTIECVVMYETRGSKRDRESLNELVIEATAAIRRQAEGETNDLGN